jgi:hypothetical protein
MLIMPENIRIRLLKCSTPDLNTRLAIKIHVDEVNTSEIEKPMYHIYSGICVSTELQYYWRNSFNKSFAEFPACTEFGCGLFNRSLYIFLMWLDLAVRNQL